MKRMWRRILSSILVAVMLSVGLPIMTAVSQAEDISHLTPVEVTLDSNTRHSEKDIPMSGNIERLYKVTINEDGVYYFSASTNYLFSYTDVYLLKEKNLSTDSIVSQGNTSGEITSLFKYLKKGETYYVYMKNDIGGDSVIYEGKTVAISLYRDNDTKIIDNVWYKKGNYRIWGSKEDEICYSVIGNNFVGNEKKLTILNEIDGIKVKSIGERAFKDSSIEQLVLGDNIVEINSSAFSGTRKLNSVVFPDSLNHISSYAFSGAGLPDITLSKGLKMVSATAFNGCRNMKNIYVDEGNEEITSIDGVVYSKDKTIVLLYPESHGDSYAIVEGTKNIGEFCFYGTNIKDIKLPSTLKSIGIYAFSDCFELDHINLPEGLGSIGQHAFNNCTSLICLDFPESVSNISTGVFVGCTQLESVIIRNKKCYMRFDSGFDNNMPKKLTIYGYGESDAQVYAEKAGANFVDITRDEQTECEHLFVPYRIIEKNTCLEEQLGSTVCAICGIAGENVAVKPSGHIYAPFNYPFCVECLAPKEQGGDLSIDVPINVQLEANKTAAYKYKSTQSTSYEVTFENCTKEMEVWIVIVDENYDIKSNAIYTVGKSPLSREVQMDKDDYLMLGFEYFPSETDESTSNVSVDATLKLIEIIPDVTPTPSATPKVKVGKAKIKSARNVKKKTIVVKFAKTKNAKKYKVQYSLNKKFKKAKSKIIARRTYKIKKLKKGKKYFIRVRGVNGKSIGAWSKVKKVKVKK